MFTEDNFELDENGRKLSKWVENTVGKGGIARYEQFLLFPQCFQKACFPEASKGVIVWEWVKCSRIESPFPPPTHTHTQTQNAGIKMHLNYGLGINRIYFAGRKMNFKTMWNLLKKKELDNF